LKPNETSDNISIIYHPETNIIEFSVITTDLIMFKIQPSNTTTANWSPFILKRSSNLTRAFREHPQSQTQINPDLVDVCLFSNFKIAKTSANCTKVWSSKELSEANIELHKYYRIVNGVKDYKTFIYTSVYDDKKVWPVLVIDKRLIRVRVVNAAGEQLEEIDVCDSGRGGSKNQ